MHHKAKQLLSWSIGNPTYTPIPMLLFLLHSQIGEWKAICTSNSENICQLE